MRNKRRIRLTGIFTDWQDGNRESWFKECLFLRHARNVGDEEVVNNFVLGRLRYAQETGQITFEELT